jgi:ATP-dependent protease ClpP protease subunit
MSYLSAICIERISRLQLSTLVTQFFSTCALQGMSLVPAVTELLLAEFMYLQYDSPTRPIFLYINSTGVQVRAVPLC